jgi:hypothetical protein
MHRETDSVASVAAKVNEFGFGIAISFEPAEIGMQSGQPITRGHCDIPAARLAWRILSVAP